MMTSETTTMAISPAEVTVIAKALREDVDVAIPSNASKITVLKTLDLCCTSVKGLEGATERFQNALGYVLKHIQAHRLYEPEYTTMKAFVEAEVEAKYGIRRAATGYHLRIAKAFHKHEPKELVSIPTRNLILASRIANDDDLRESKAVLKRARELTPGDFATWASKTGKVTHKGAQGPAGGTATLVIRGSHKLLQIWNKWREENQDLAPGDLLVKTVEVARAAGKLVGPRKATAPARHQMRQVRRVA